VLFVADQNEMSADAIFGDELLKKGSRELDGLAGGATSQNVPDCSTIVVQILIRCDVQVKFVPVHRISVIAAQFECYNAATASISI
jgi:hypothetical protein